MSPKSDCGLEAVQLPPPFQPFRAAGGNGGNPPRAHRSLGGEEREEPRPPLQGEAGEVEVSDPHAPQASMEAAERPMQNHLRWQGRVGAGGFGSGWGHLRKAGLCREAGMEGGESADEVWGGQGVGRVS